MSKLSPGKEYERKFLVLIDKLPKRLPKPQRIVQGYLSLTPLQRRVRTINGRTAVLEVKGPNDREDEPIPLTMAEARKLLRHHTVKKASHIKKRRHVLRSAWKGLKWEIDVFDGANRGLVVAEIETPTKRYRLDPKKFPKWVGPEVTDDPSFKNRILAVRPFKAWTRKEKRETLRKMSGK